MTELSSVEMQAAIDNNYGKLQLAFKNVRIILKTTCQHQKLSAKSKQQATVTHILSRAPCNIFCSKVHT